MLCLSLQPGEYLSIGENVILQYDCTSGDKCRLIITAPREVQVLRGAVLERNGEKRPECVFEKSHWHKREIPWDRSKAQALKAMWNMLERMERRGHDIRRLRAQLNHIFPESEGNGEAT